MKYFRVSCALPSLKRLINNTASVVSHSNVSTSVVGKVGVDLASTRPLWLEGKGCVWRVGAGRKDYVARARENVQSWGL